MQRLGSCGDGSNRTMSHSPVDPYSLPQQKAARGFGFNSFNAFNSPVKGSASSFTPSPSSCNEESNSAETDKRLYLARLTLEYQQLVARYGICLNHLQESVNEGEKLREENAALRVANKDLTRRLTLLTEISIRHRYLSPGFPSLSIINDFRNLSVGDGGRVNGQHVSGEVSDNKSPTSVIESNRFEKKNGERVTLPKSISVRSSGYLKANPPAAGGSTSTSTRTNRLRSLSPVKTETQRVFVPGGNQEEDALEFDVYNQGMFKTELCNKWQETGACPYGDHCQFAHGINELRPIIRHPRYKTEVCRMVLAGDPCPYGHRCHFRHALTEQERLTGTS